MLFAGGVHGRSISNNAFVYAPRGSTVPRAAYSTKLGTDASGLSTMQIIWLIVGSVFAVLLLLAGAFIVTNRRRRAS